MQGEWIRSGTVTVTQGSPVVVGISTAWELSGVLLGEFFVGPDGKLYEITAVYKVGDVGPDPLSSERIEIRSLAGVDEYEGETATGSYSIIRNWSNTTNSVLAAKIADLIQSSVFAPGGGLVRYGTEDPPTGVFPNGTLYIKY